jgi:lipopolysaccharide/colanic/teichoic acid biosynthesis glycosyltransferase
MIRLCDIFFSSIALLILSPLLMPVALLLRLTGEGEVFFVQERIGINGQPFGLLKFATMLKNSPNIGAGTITVRDDPRVLPVGRVLRKTKINELPQLINVLLGEMSVIGPRPLTQNHFEHYFPPMRRLISSVAPGLSGIGSIVFRDEESLLSDQPDPATYYKDEIAPYKAELEAWFVNNRGLRLYLKCIVVTIWAILKPSSRLAVTVFEGIPLPKGRLKADLENIS